MLSQIIMALLCLLMTPSLAKAGEGGFRIKGYLSTGEDARFVSVAAGRGSGVTSGEVFRVVRPAQGGMTSPIETGLLKVVAVHEHESIAEVVQQSTPQSEAVYGAYANVMAGDLAVGQRISISRAKVLAPEITIKYSAIFDDPKSMPVSFELTPGGRKEIRNLASQVAGMKSGMLIVEGHTDQKGDSEQNQIESYQRALTVRQVLIEDLGFDESRVTAIGLGESEPISDVILPGNADRSRRIVLKLVPVPGGY